MSTVSRPGSAPDPGRSTDAPVDGQVGPLRAPGRSLPVGTFLVALGTFLLTVSVLLPLYVHERVAVLPAETHFDMRLVDEEAAYLDPSTWSWVEDTEIVRTTQVVGSAHGSDWSAWEMSVDTSVSDRMIDHWSRRVIVDRSTGRAVNCCGEHVNGDRAVRQAGLVLHFPPGAREESYLHYDAEVRSAPALEFEEEDEVAGISVLRYSQEIEDTQVPDSAREVPASLFTSGEDGTVTATRWLEATRTFWVEPVSGMVVNAEETRVETLRPRGGGGSVPLLEADLALVDQQVSGYVEQARTRSLLLRALESWALWTLGPFGVLMALAGVFRAWRYGDRRTPQETSEEDPGKKVPHGDGAKGAKNEGTEDTEEPAEEERTP